MPYNLTKIFLIMIMLTLFSLSSSSAETIDVYIKGVDDGVKTNKQKDYKEAVMNAKLQAIEQAGQIQKGVKAEAACAIVGMSAEQCQLTALQRARAAAIEQAAGVSVTSATLVTNLTLVADFIKTYTRGYIVSEKVTWLPLGQYQKDPASPPIPEYRVKIVADVYIPRQKAKTLGLKAKLNNTVFRAGEKAKVTVQTKKSAGIALFNIMANDTVSLLFPNAYEKDNRLAAGDNFIFPAIDAKVELEMHTLPGHQKDAEALLVVAWEEASKINILDYFTPGDSLSVQEYFAKLAAIIDRCEETILPYEVVNGDL
ncbi:MAG TPA: DUF4384 domain-containing protein [Paludibacteraceae bacterium]|jgi:hypothetical protein|nr:DUF4384 domain-containing protein [Burkholderiales bacterium]MDI9560203.1 DUF4384 domain-containing protein [Pseudomonadota bacterium]OQC47044.1 MAG: hypothetical protein BWX58_01766 [Deltaproteobacteria bacterium ADurb.Bin026]HPM11378.1 DUF4384 domain-containing protein [Paludibacter sp.]HQF11743.1 DUF4384 domain-containing protein [Paludibacteraceae bacterium]